MKTSHTLGPWRMTRHHFKMIKVESNDRVICDGFDNEEANALLIAAAPEMYAILHACITINAEGISDRGNAALRLNHITRMALYAINLAKGNTTPSPI